MRLSELLSISKYKKHIICDCEGTPFDPNGKDYDVLRINPCENDTALQVFCDYVDACVDLYDIGLED